jgi:phenylalanine-4-hydroxylase
MKGRLFQYWREDYDLEAVGNDKKKIQVLVYQVRIPATKDLTLALEYDTKTGEVWARLMNEQKLLLQHARCSRFVRDVEISDKDFKLLERYASDQALAEETMTDLFHTIRYPDGGGK